MTNDVSSRSEWQRQDSLRAIEKFTNFYPELATHKQLLQDLTNNTYGSNKNKTKKDNEIEVVAPCEKKRRCLDDEYSHEEIDNHVEEEEQIAKIKKNKLSLAIQGFRSRASTFNNTSIIEQSFDKELETKEFHGIVYHKRRCYIVKVGKETNATVGILKFLPTKPGQQCPFVECVLIVPFEDTFLGMEDDEIKGYMPDYQPSEFVQVHNQFVDLPITRLMIKSGEVECIPELVYEPQIAENGRWQQFGYFYNNKPHRKGPRMCFNLLEIFVGAGGMSLGYHNAGRFKTKLAIDNNPDALLTLKTNFNGINVFEGDAKDFLIYLESDIGRKMIGRIDHVHISPPCQGFSGANISGGKNDKANNELSMLIVDFVRVTKCTTAVFENVLGMWRRKHVQYVKNICKELLKLGYQVRCTQLKACDYGDPQKRPRFFIFVSHKSAPPPVVPSPTHGGLLPHVTVNDAFCSLSTSTLTRSDIEGKQTKLKPGQHGLVKLDGDSLAPAIRASSLPPFHPSEDRCINVREAACLQSFPINYVFSGNMTSKYRQIGNAVPVELATAVARSMGHILMFEYDDKDTEADEKFQKIVY